MRNVCKLIGGLVCLVVVLLACNITSLAAGTIESVCNDEAKSVSINGTIPSERPDRKIMLVVVRPNQYQNFKNTQSISKDVIYYISQTITGSNGAFTFNFNLDPNVMFGEYNVLVGAALNDMTQESSFVFIDEATRIKAVNDLKAATSAQQTADLILNTYSIVFKLNTKTGSVYDKLNDKSFVPAYLFNNRGNYNSVQDVQTYFDKAVIVQNINEATVNTIGDAIVYGNDKLGLDLDTDYYKNYKSYVHGILVNISFTDISHIQSEFPKAVALGAANALSVSDRAGMSEILTIYKDYVKTPEAYWNFEPKVEIHKLLLSWRPYQNVEAIGQYVSTAMEQVEEEEEASQPATSPGGGGGGGGSTTRISATNVGPVIPVITDAPAAAEAENFEDTDNVPWAQESIKELRKLKVIDGVGDNRFAPDNNVTREEFLTLLIKAFGTVDQNVATDFSDVDKNMWYYPYIATAQKLEVVKGTADATFGIGQSITRQDMAAMAYRVAGKANVILDPSDEEIDFTDKDKIADYAVESIKVMKKSGIINGYEDKNFEPNGFATRAQAAKIIYGLLKYKK